MQRLIQGIHQFQQDGFRPLQGLFEQLAKKQSPETLFVTCSDSRIDPNLLTRSRPGDLFILRNAGNIVPPHGAANGGEAATIEFAVAALGVKDIIICGHSHVPFIGVDRGITMFNPGSIGPRRFMLPIVFGMVDVTPSGVRLAHVDVETGAKWVPPQQ